MVNDDTNTSASDLELLESVRQGDESAFGTLYDRHLDAARAAAYRLVRQHHTVEDVAHDAFARIFHAVRRGKGPTGGFRSYMYAVIKHLAGAEFQRAARERPSTVDDLLLSTQLIDDREMIDPENDLILAAYQTLPDRWRQVLRKVNVEGISAGAAGMSLQLNPSATQALVKRAREGLKEAYLQQHTGIANRSDCKETLQSLGAKTRGTLSRGWLSA